MKGHLAALALGALPGLVLYGAALPLRRRRIAADGKQTTPLRECAMALFWMFCGGMAVLTLTPRWVASSLPDALAGRGWHLDGGFFRLGSVNLVPFRTFAADSHSLYILAGNVGMFLPFGFFCAALGLCRTRSGALALGFAITVGVETWQLLVGRTFDVDDLMLNALGVVLGYALWRMLERWRPELGRCCRLREDFSREWERDGNDT